MKGVLKLFLGLILLLLFSFGSYGEDIDYQKIKESLPKMLGANNVGKDFWITFLPCWENVPGAQNNVKIYVSSGVPTDVTVEVPGKGFRQVKRTIPNDIIVFDIPGAVAQPYSKLDTQQPLPDQVFVNYGVHVYANDPIIVYGVTRYQYTSDGYLALPTSSLGKEYIVASYADPATNEFQWLPSYVGIVGVYDNTLVRFTLGGNPYTTTKGGLTPGQYAEEILNKGDVWLLAGFGANADLSGSKIKAKKDVAVVSGNYCAYIPSDKGYCDYIAEMELPTSTWGKDYHVTRIFTRLKNSIIKVFPKEPNTKIFRDGKQIALIPQAGGQRGFGYIEIRADDGAPRPVVISGDKPISVTQFNPGQDDDFVSSDPFQLVLTPLQQYQTEIVFNTPGIRGGFGFNTNYINLVYEATPEGFMPDDLEFATVVNGEFDWRRLKDIDASPGDPFVYDVEGKKFYSKTILLPGDGVYKIRAKKPFAAYAYGFSNYDSYGFPTSVALGDLEKPDTIAPHPKWDMTCDGSVMNGYVEDMPKDPTIRSNLAMIVFHKDLSYNYRFRYSDFIPGEDYKTNWELEVIDKAKDALAVITFSDRRGNDSTIVIRYFATNIFIEPTYVNYGLHKTGEETIKTFYLINHSKTSVLIDALTLLYKDQGFEILDLRPRFIMNSMDTIPFRVKFTASQEGMFRDSIGVGDTCIFAWHSYIEAKVGNPGIEVSDAIFGDVSIGKSETKQFSIRNTGTVNLVITGYTGPTNVDVFTTNLPPISKTNPLILKPGEELFYRVTFSPKAEISYPDYIVFHNDATYRDSICVLGGRGIQGALIATSINWKRLRIDRPGFDNDGPYPATPEYSDCAIGGFKLTNDGSEKVTVSGLIVKSVNPPGSDYVFEFNRNLFTNGFDIPPGSEVIIPVMFHPTQVGDYEFTFQFENSVGSTTETKLTGTGILPRITTIDMHFDTTVVNDVDNPKFRQITFTNEIYEYNDTLTITDFAVSPANSISKTWANYGTEGFKFDIDALNLPVTLVPGESLTINAQFVAVHSGDATAYLRSVSDAEEDKTSKWTGFGISLQPVITSGPYPTICVDETALIPCRISVSGNTGFVRIDSIKFDPILPDFSFEDPSILEPFALSVGQIKIFNVIYNPVSTGPVSTNVIVYNNSLDYPVIKTTITGNAVFYTRTTSSRISKSAVNIGEKDIEYIISLNPGADITLSGLNSLDVEIIYKGDFLALNQSSVQTPGSTLSNFKTEIIDTLNSINRVSFNITRNQGIYNQPENLVLMKFNAFLPWYWKDQQGILKDSIAFIKHSVRPVNTECLSISSDSINVQLNPVCANNLRPIIISGKPYNLKPIVPNPVSGEGGVIEFSIALEGETDLSIYNTNGVLMKNLVSGVMKAGDYSISIPIGELPSGKYFVRLISGAFTDTKEMTIAK